MVSFYVLNTVYVTHVTTKIISNMEIGGPIMIQISR